MGATRLGQAVPSGRSGAAMMQRVTNVQSAMLIWRFFSMSAASCCRGTSGASQGAAGLARSRC